MIRTAIAPTSANMPTPKQNDSPAQIVMMIVMVIFYLVLMVIRK